MTTVARTRTHTDPPVVSVHSHWGLDLLPGVPLEHPTFLRNAARSTRLLPAEIHDVLADFADDSGPTGSLLLRGVPVGLVPPTPDRPTAPYVKDHISEFALLTVASRLGHPVGYLPEQGGRVVQNILPTPGAAARQISTSSKAELMFHTEAAFHPHRPRYLLLLCLRGNPEAVTTLAAIREVLPLLDEATVDVLFERRFRTAADESYRTIDDQPRDAVLGEPVAVLRGDRRRPSMVFDADLMVGTDATADRALHDLADAIAACHCGVALQAGDLLVVDNDAAVHGRRPFRARFDGSDRWVQRAFAVSDLGPSARERLGRVIVTQF